jgi:predicted ribosomally synthesized peptide with nif11-like leader
MSTENVRRFVELVAQNARLAGEIKAIPAGSGAEAAFVKLAEREGYAFSVLELQQEAARADGASRQETETEEGDDGLWVLDYFYGPQGKWTK